MLVEENEGSSGVWEQNEERNLLARVDVPTKGHGASLLGLAVTLMADHHVAVMEAPWRGRWRRHVVAMVVGGRVVVIIVDIVVFEKGVCVAPVVSLLLLLKLLVVVMVLMLVVRIRVRPRQKLRVHVMRPLWKQRSRARF